MLWLFHGLWCQSPAGLTKWNMIHTPMSYFLKTPSASKLFSCNFEHECLRQRNVRKSAHGGVWGGGSVETQTCLSPAWNQNSTFYFSLRKVFNFCDVRKGISTQTMIFFKLYKVLLMPKPDRCVTVCHLTLSLPAHPKLVKWHTESLRSQCNVLTPTIRFNSQQNVTRKTDF